MLEGKTIPVFGTLVILSLVILFIALLLRKFKQPYLIAYIIAGIVLGPDVLGIVSNKNTISELGELGVIFLMFFIGAEINLPDLTKNIKKPLIGTISQLMLSFICISTVGFFLDWNINMIILLSFVLSLSSSAIIFQYLYINKKINSNIGLLTTGVLLLQDILVVPMLITINFMGQGELNLVQLIGTSVGGILIIIFLRAAMKHRLLKLPLNKDVQEDQDLQIFIGLFICFGLAWLTQFIGLSSALGAFVAGIFIGQDESTEKLKHNLNPFRVFFLALFFISIGLQLNTSFFIDNIGVILLLVLFVLLINSLINSFVFKAMNIKWKDSVFAGALLSQIGEFSFVLSATAFNLNIIEEYSYQITLSVIMLTMVSTSFWIWFIRRFLFRK